MQRLILIGHNGNANDVIDMIEALRTGGTMIDVLGYLDDGGPARGCLRQLPWLGPVTDARKWVPAHFVLAIGSERTYKHRWRIFHRTGLDETVLSTLVHPMAQVSPAACLGQGTVVHYGCFIGAYAVLETGVYVAPRVHVGHDTKVGAWSIIAPGANICGHVMIGRGVYVGAGAMIRNGVRIGDGALIGMGAVITKDVDPDSVVVGNPGRMIAHSSTDSCAQELVV